MSLRNYKAISRSHRATRSSKKSSIFVGGIRFDTTKQDISKDMSRFGKIVSIVIPEDGPRALLGFAIVTYKTLRMANMALKHDRIMVKGKSVSLKPYDPSKRANDIEIRKIFVVGIPFYFEEQRLFEFFSTISEVKEVKIVRNPATGEKKAFGFIWTHDDRSFDNIVNIRYFKINDIIMEAIPSISRHQLKLQKKRLNLAPNYTWSQWELEQGEFKEEGGE